MSNQRDSGTRSAGGRQGAGDPGAAKAAVPAGADEHGAPRETMKRKRLDTIELADDLTEPMNPQHAADDVDDGVGEMLEGRESNAHYRHEANRVTPTLGPDEDRDAG